MTHTAMRRTPATNVRQVISESLDQIDAIEHGMTIYFRKGDHRELARARANFRALRRHVDQLGAMIADAEYQTADHVLEAAE